MTTSLDIRSLLFQRELFDPSAVAPLPLSVHALTLEKQAQRAAKLRLPPGRPVAQGPWRANQAGGLADWGVIPDRGCESRPTIGAAERRLLILGHPLRCAPLMPRHGIILSEPGEWAGQFNADLPPAPVARQSTQRMPPICRRQR
jgi:hypothetical protein